MDICDLYNSTLEVERGQHKALTAHTNIMMNRAFGSVSSVYTSHLLWFLRSHERVVNGDIKAIEMANTAILLKDTLTITPSKQTTALLWSEKFKNLYCSVPKVLAAEECH